MPRPEKSPLFELMRDPEKGVAGNRVSLPPWMRTGDEKTEPDNAETENGRLADLDADVAGKTEPERGEDVISELRDSEVETAHESQSDSSPKTHRFEQTRLWLAKPVTGPASRGKLIVAATILIVVIAGAYFGGRFHQNAVFTEQMNQHAEQVAGLEAVRISKPNYNLIDSRVAGVSDGAGAEVRKNVPKSTDLRTPGLNYYFLMTISARSRSEGERAVEFLRENGIDAALIPVKNGSRLSLAVLRGFRRLSSPEAKTFRQELLRLGRKWKATRRGYTDWHDLIAYKYTLGN